MFRTFRFSLAAVSVLLALPILTLAQRASFTVGTATAAVGQKANGYIEVPAGVDAATNIPVVVVNGAKPGPVLALVTGAHGTEPQKTNYSAPSPFQMYKPALKMLNVEEVGHYAIRIEWSDGHSSGIYSFDHLRVFVRGHG